MKQPLELKRILVRIILPLVPVTLKMENSLRIPWITQMAQWAAKKRNQTVFLMATIQKVWPQSSLTQQNSLWKSIKNTKSINIRKRQTLFQIVNKLCISYVFVFLHFKFTKPMFLSGAIHGEVIDWERKIYSEKNTTISPRTTALTWKQLINKAHVQ